MASGTLRRIRTAGGQARYEVRLWWVARGQRHEERRRFRTKAEARAYHDETLARVRAGDDRQPSAEPLGRLVTRWLAIKAHAWQPSTLLLRRGAWERYGRDPLGAIPLRELDPADIQAVYEGMLGRGLGASSVESLHRLLAGALDHAVAQGRLAHNPARRCTVPPLPKRTARWWTAGQVAAFLAATADDADAVLWELLFRTGLRMGELLALRWADVDLAGARLIVRRTLTRTAQGRTVIRDGVKARGSARTVPLTLPCQAALRRQRQAAGSADAEALVFDGPDGGIRARDGLAKRLDALIAEAGLPRITPHGARHTAATVALAAGVPAKVVAEMLGHSSITVTLDLYAHIDEGMRLAGFEALDAALAGGDVGTNAATAEGKTGKTA